MVAALRIRSIGLNQKPRGGDEGAVGRNRCKRHFSRLRVAALHGEFDFRLGGHELHDVQQPRPIGRLSPSLTRIRFRGFTVFVSGEDDIRFDDFVAGRDIGSCGRTYWR